VSKTKVSKEKLKCFFENELFFPQLAVRDSNPSTKQKRMKGISLFFMVLQGANLRIIRVLINNSFFFLLFNFQSIINKYLYSIFKKKT
jgi:hypothetical protein